MKKLYNHFFLSTIALLLCLPDPSIAQDWPTDGGNNMNNGLTSITGPQSYQVEWTQNSSFNSAFGNSVFVAGDRFITARTLFSPIYFGVIECRRVSDGELLWEFQPNSAAKMYAVGFDENAAYAHDYTTNILYAIDPITGDEKWQFPITMFGGNTGLVFACNGDPIMTNYRLDRRNGDVVWNNNYPTPIGPDAGFAMSKSTLYHYTGYFNYPKEIIAIDPTTGDIKYKTGSLPGDGDQELPVTLGPDNRVYMTRDGGSFWAFHDDGDTLVPLFNSAYAFTWHVAIDHDDNIVGFFNNHLYRMDHETGDIMDESPVEIVSTAPRITIDGTGRVFVNNYEAGAGKMYCLSPSLQEIIWQTNIPYGYYCDPNLTKDGRMILTQSGSQIRALLSPEQLSTLAPVAGFYTWTRDIHRNNTVDFFDNSSYQPTSWEWTFEGGYPQTSTQQNPTGIQYVQSGEFEVKLKVTNAPGVDSITKQCYINVDEIVDIENISLSQNLLISPNPVKDYVVLTLPNSEVNWNVVSIYNSLGQIFYERNIVSETELGIDLNSWPSGIYFVEIKSDNQSFTNKLIKN